MKTLPDVEATDEQLKIISRNKPGVEIIRGAAGSGKTTTALLRLRASVGMFLSRRERAGDPRPVEILILTYNRTLRGYINELAKHQVGSSNVCLTVSTFAKWAVNELGRTRIISDEHKRTKLTELAYSISLDKEFLFDEVEYAMGRFLPNNIDEYLDVRRDGRGVSPRVDRALREQLVNHVIKPYQHYIDDQGLWDWNDLAVHFAANKAKKLYDIIIVDEAQDFSANQIRAIKNQVRDLHSLTFILDTAQRIYARGYIWTEVGLAIRPEQSHRLEVNYRNTRQIAEFALPLINGIPLDADATLPDFESTSREGALPLVLEGKYSDQLRYVISHINNSIDLTSESVAFLHPRGWFREVKKQLEKSKLNYVEITKAEDWPQGSENIALSTLHSAKGLEFDHVILIGLNGEVTQHGSTEDDDTLLGLRRLLAMGLGRARTGVIVGYKPEEASHLVSYFEKNTFKLIRL